MLNYFALLKIQPGTGQSGVEEGFVQFKLCLAGYAPGIEMNDGEIAQRFPDVWEAYQILLDPLRREDLEKKLSPVAEQLEQPNSELMNLNESLRSRIGSSFIQAGFIIILLICIYTLVHFAAI